MAEQNAWRDLVVEQIPALRGFAWSVSRNGPDADDLVQETLIKAWRHRDRFTPGTNQRAWLFTILRNTHDTMLSRRRRDVRDEDDHHTRKLDCELNQEWRAALSALRTTLEHLPSDQREALILVGARASATSKRLKSAPAPSAR